MANNSKKELEQSGGCQTWWWMVRIACQICNSLISFPQAPLAHEYGVFEFDIAIEPAESMTPDIPSDSPFDFVEKKLGILERFAREITSEHRVCWKNYTKSTSDPEFHTL